jgi:hypothetical protein
MRFGQSAADADTLTRARPLATSTERVSCHTEENLGVDQVVQVDVPVATGHSRARTEKLPSRLHKYVFCKYTQRSESNTVADAEIVFASSSNFFVDDIQTATHRLTS